MTLGFPREWYVRVAWLAVSLAGILAAAAPWIGSWRVAITDDPARGTILVTTGTDGGRGSLREAILTADRADRHMRIIVRVPRVTITAPLPPLVNPNGILLEAHQDGTTLDVPRIAGAIIDIAAPHTVVQGFHIAKAQVAVVVRAPNATLRNVTIEDGETGILIGEGAEDTTIESSFFRRNGIGIHAMAGGKVTVNRSRFEEHRSAAVWAADARIGAGLPEFSVRDSHFTNDMRGLVLVNRPSQVEQNVFEGEREPAIFSSGNRASIRANRILAGRSFGIHLDRVSSSVVDRNEIAHNCSGGVMIRGARNTEVRSNELYKNGIGIVMFEGSRLSPNIVADNLVADHMADGLLVVGSSPLVRYNRLLQNAHSGLRLAMIRGEDGAIHTASPLLEGNVLRGNLRNEPYRDEYTPADPDAAVPTPADCSWRKAALASSRTEGLR